MLDARAQWPTGMDRLGVPLKGKIAPEEALLAGRAVARLSDLGWGQRLRELLREDAPASAELVRGCVEVLAGWGWAAASRRHRLDAVAPHPELVRSLAAGLGEVGRLPFLGALDLAQGGPVGEPGGNSAFRLAGVWGRLVVGADLAAALTASRPGAPRRRPRGLAVDPHGGRRALRLAGAPGVLPLALAVDG